jgi:hypothetical protein
VAQDPAAYQPRLAQALGNLGNVYGGTHRFADAKAALQEAVGIERKLVARNPAVHGPDLVTTLKNLASLYRDMHRDGDAQAAEAEALAAETGTNSPAQNGTETR